MKEYKIIDGAPVDCQKLLNQWKHQYEIEIYAQSLIIWQDAPYMIITLSREAK